MAVPCVGSPTGCLGSPASCCSGRRCSTPPMTSGQRRSPEPPPKATRLDPLHPTKNSDHVAEHWSLISGRKSHQAPLRPHPIKLTVPVHDSIKGRVRSSKRLWIGWGSFGRALEVPALPYLVLPREGTQVTFADRRVRWP